MKKRDDEPSIKEVIMYREHWIHLFLGWYWEGILGKTAFFPAEVYKWNDLKRYNADLRNSQSDMGWSEAVAFLNRYCQSLLEFVDERSDQELFDGPMEGRRTHGRTDAEPRQRGQAIFGRP